MAGIPSPSGVSTYIKPRPPATEALLRVERLPHPIWEPTAGRGAIAKVLRAHGHAVICNDIVDYGFPLHMEGDFLATTAMPAGCEAIVTNPPFRKFEHFVAHALELSPLTIMLPRFAFFESERRLGSWRVAGSLGSTASANGCRCCIGTAGKAEKQIQAWRSPGSCGTGTTPARP